MQVTISCNICGKVEVLDVDPAEYAAYKAGMRIQDALRSANSFTRESLISHMCFDCISKIFNKPKPGEDWGKMLGSCPCCDCSIYESNFKGDNVTTCPFCSAPLTKEELDGYNTSE